MGDEYVDENTSSGNVSINDNSSDKPQSNDELSVSQLVNYANEAYDNAVNAQKNGDWAGYGKYLDELHGYLQQLNEISGESGSNKSNDSNENE